MSVEQFFQRQLPVLLSQQAQLFPDEVIFGFWVEGQGGGTWQLNKSGSEIDIGPLDMRPKDCELRCHVQVFSELISGRLNPFRAFASGQLVLQGDVGLALRLQNMLGLKVGEEL